MASLFYEKLSVHRKELSIYFLWSMLYNVINIEGK